MTRRPRSDLFVPGADTARANQRRVRWTAQYRIINSRYPPIDIFERIAPKGDWDALYELEGLTNPRLRQEAGEISLVPPQRRVNGPNASIVMAAFTHLSPSRTGRFSDGTFGVYYAARKFETALREVAFHCGRFHAATADPAAADTYRAYKGSVDRQMHDITRGSWTHLLDPDPANYGKPQSFAAALRLQGSNGIVYPSVRHPGGECIAAFWPDVVSLPVQERHLQFRWDGKRVTGWFDMTAGGAWQPL